MKKLNLNEEQKRAVECDDDLILCMAGAGSGKTTVLIERISRICEKEDPKSILALTFTNAAAFEMKDRYIRRNPGKIVPEFRTFHSFCYSVLCTDYEIRNKLGYHSVPSICDEAKMKRIQNTVYIELGLHLSKDELTGKVKLSPKKQQEFNLYKKRIKKVMKDENIITFDELSSSICDLFFNEDTLTNKYKKRFKYLLIDEFQDTSPEQWKFATSFKHSKIFLVGDEKQAIYSFRGADSSIIKMLSELDNWTHIYLPRNYRSTKQICSFANKVVRQSGSKLKIELVSDKSGPSVTVLPSTSNRYSEPIGVDDFATFCEMNRELEGTTAILCRSNSEVAEVCRMLDGVGLNYLTGKKNTDYKYILRSVKDNEYLADWLASYLNADKYADFIRIQSIENMSRIDVIVNYFSNVKEIQERLRKVVTIRKALKDPSRSRMSMAVDILTICGFNPLDNQIEVDENCSYDELFEAITSVIEEKIVSDLYVGTIHSSKGLEYDNVFLFNVNDYSFKLNKEDQWNLYYVGVTRAKTNLVIFKGDAY